MCTFNIQGLAATCAVAVPVFWHMLHWPATLRVNEAGGGSGAVYTRPSANKGMGT
jgi:hypothetical protein